MENAVARTEQEAWGLVMEHEREIVGFARSTTRRLRVFAAREDAEQEARLAAFWAALRYDPAKGTQFMSWARYWIWLYVRRALLCPLVSGDAHCEKKLQITHLDAIEEECWPSALTRIIDPDDPLLEQERERIVKEVVGRMSARMRAVAVRCLLCGETYQQVGEELGYSRELIRRIRNQAISRIQWELWDLGMLDLNPTGCVSQFTPE